MFECILDGYGSKTSLFVVTDFMIVKLIFTISRINTVGQLYISIFKQGHHCHQLEGGARLKQSARSIVEFFVEATGPVGTQV